MFLLLIYNCTKNNTFNTFNYLDKIPTLMCFMLDKILHHEATFWSQDDNNKNHSATSVCDKEHNTSTQQQKERDREEITG